ncbi:hypothetical protein [Serratia nematodiphila]|uniref:hypothetical protein n=1 Tax=Serratia nematodiphila TaxID=458197 RepID=UPI0011D309CA|nr:hypothetical protein [Serratia nematodiphila]TXE58989.1 hypothetical protein FOT58_18855 [Serratia nematodiphila]
MNYLLDYKQAIAYTDAMEFLISHYAEFPAKVPSGGPCAEISNALHKNHRFILTPEGEVVFGDCIIPGINAEEFNEYRRTVSYAGKEPNHG